MLVGHGIGWVVLNQHATGTQGQADQALTPRSEVFTGVPEDLSTWVGYPGQGCIVKVQGSESNRGGRQGVAGYWVKPGKYVSGFQVPRQLEVHCNVSPHDVGPKSSMDPPDHGRLLECANLN